MAKHTMKLGWFLLCSVLLSCIGAIGTATVHADVVVLKTGERFSSTKVWEEQGKIHFDLQGLAVTVDQSEIAEVIRAGAPASPSEPSSISTKTHTLADPNGIDPTPSGSSETSARSTMAEGPETGAKSKVRGIGLDGIAWQMRPSEIRGIEKFGTDPAYGGIDEYTRPHSHLTFGDVLLDGLVFGFWREHLYSIMIWVDGKSGYERLRQVVFERYGHGTKSEKKLERFIWLDEATDRMLEFDSKLNTGIFWMRSRDLDQQVKKLFPE